MNDRLRQIANVVTALTQAAVPALGYAGYYGKPVDSQSQATKTLVVPADYAFAIWALIFALCLAYAIFQARGSVREDATLRRIGWLTAAAFLGNTVWSLIAQQDGPIGILAIILTLTAAAIVAALLRLRHATTRAGHHWLVRVSIGVLAGWASVATFANWSVAAAVANLRDVPVSATLQSAILLSGAGTSAVIITRRSGGSLAYVLTILWAFAGISVAALMRENNLVLAGLAILWGIAVCMSSLQVRRGAQPG